MKDFEKFLRVFHWRPMFHWRTVFFIGKCFICEKYELLHGVCSQSRQTAAPAALWPPFRADLELKLKTCSRIPCSRCYSPRPSHTRPIKHKTTLQSIPPVISTYTTYSGFKECEIFRAALYLANCNITRLHPLEPEIKLTIKSPMTTSLHMSPRYVHHHHTEMPEAAVEFTKLHTSTSSS